MNTASFIGATRRSNRAGSGLFEKPKARAARAISDSIPPPGSTADLRLRAAALLELARARHHLRRASGHLPKVTPESAEPPELRMKGRPKTKIEGHSPLIDLIQSSRIELAALAFMGKSTGPSLSRAANRLISLERAGVITSEQSAMALAKIITAISHTEVKGMSQNRSDTPPELAAYSDGMSDNGAFHPEIIGTCSCPNVSGLQHVNIGAGLSDLAVAGIPSYLLSRRSLSNPIVRRRVASAIERMTPKMKRRVLARLETAVSVARVSGEIRGAYPSIAGNVGWSGVMVGASRGGCPYANVAGALTP